MWNMKSYKWLAGLCVGLAVTALIYNLNCGSTFRETAYIISPEVIQSNVIVHGFDLRQAVE